MYSICTTTYYIHILAICTLLFFLPLSFLINIWERERGGFRNKDREGFFCFFACFSDEDGRRVEKNKYLFFTHSPGFPPRNRQRGIVFKSLPPRPHSWPCSSFGISGGPKKLLRLGIPSPPAVLDEIKRKRKGIPTSRLVNRVGERNTKPGGRT